MSKPRRETPAPNVPKIEKCPRCGANVLIGDKRCSNCGYNLMTLEDSVRSLNPLIVGLVTTIIGAAFALAAIGQGDRAQLIFLLIGSAFFIGGGAFVGLSYVMTDRKRPRN
ncbi:MAG: zinc ribbon domain-containing protein [Chloroflexi bacterium]|nr:zinc ribbon domain-containing protein [Chloroflexota bacterium]